MSGEHKLIRRGAETEHLASGDRDPSLSSRYWWPPDILMTVYQDLDVSL